ncbi:MAG: glycosyltransferase [Phycisphaerales bacterium]
MLMTQAASDPAREARPPRKDWEQYVRMDTHCHSRASSKPLNRIVGLINCPECFSEPEQVYDQAMARGMDLVTITDHDTIAGALELIERGFERFIIGEEVSVVFPEDRCMVHVLVWGHSPDQHEQIERLGLRRDIYQFAAWLAENQLPHAFAHPLYVQNGRLSRWHIERASLLFKGFEVRNGAHADAHNRAIERFTNRLSPGLVHRLMQEHGLEPLWPRVWEKARTGGSDDHGLLNIGRTWTGVAIGAGPRIDDPNAFFARVMQAGSIAGGTGGHSALLAHQLATVGAHYYVERLHEQRSPSGRYLGSRLLRFAGVRAPAPGRLRVAAYRATRRLWKHRRARSLPIVRALRTEIGPLLEKYPELRDRLDPASWIDGAPLSDHERMADFVQDLSAAISRSMGPGLVRSFRRHDPGRIGEHLFSYAIVHLAQLPYLISLFHQNRERNLIERFEHETSERGSGISVLERPMRISLFTDTISDVNGVCRFIQNVAERAHRSGRNLEVITSTRQACPPHLPNIHNFEPVFATRMPGYEHLDLCLPPLMRILRHVDRHQPDVIHISTPGPVGCIGFLAARMLRVPVLGVYHTDFPAYVDRLFDDHGLTRLSESFMRGFYRPFTAIFTRSEDYVRSLTRLGFDGSRIVRLMPGFDVEQFNPGFADRSIWKALGVRAESIKVLYVGRVSVEKNLPQLAEVWKRVHAACRARSLDAELIVVGDGPYRAELERRLRRLDAHFLGFRHGRELSTIYASSDLFVFPSTTDTLGQVVMESQGSGLPVLVTDRGGPRELVEDGVTGFVLDPDAVDLWADRIVTLIGDERLRRRMGAAAAEAMQQFSLLNSFEHFWDVHTRAWHDHLRGLGITRDTAGIAGAGRLNNDGIQRPSSSARE